ncbi:class I adenylate-forming enzyme family protein [Roseixanthobacter pseudopolyaromaticivorans]|uniref:class I adenylate-forming enzyme family protein n=1 Tax=Xanthobacteraceae TaxID=335928 RepID=UPI00372C164A
MTGALAHLLEQPAAATARVVGDANPGFADGAALASAADAVAARLGAAGIDPREPILVSVANRPADLAALFGVWRAGGVVVPIHAAAAEATRAEVRSQTGARFLLDGAELIRVADAPPPPRPLLEKAALIIFTSGSTGRPKGVVVGHDGLAAKLDVLARLLEIGPDDEVILPLQLIFIFGVWVGLLSVSRGARLRLVTKFTPQGMREALPSGTVFAGVPSMLRAMFGDGTVVAPGLRAILTGGEALGPLLSAQLDLHLPQTDVFDLYGLTETGSCDFCLLPSDRMGGANSVGRPTEGVTYRILDAAGEEVEPDASGELSIRTPFGMLGYLDNPTLTQDSFRDGHFRTGDLARLRSDGFVEIVGRIKEIISRGGNKIAPAEIELMLLQHPDVAHALCAGVPDPRLGEAVHAAVVPRAGSALEGQALKAWCAERIERFKVPDTIHLVDALPTGPTGKAWRGGIKLLAEATPNAGVPGGGKS